MDDDMELVVSTEKQMTWYKTHEDPQVKVRSMKLVPQFVPTKACYPPDKRMWMMWREILADKVDGLLGVDVMKNIQEKAKRATILQNSQSYLC